MNLTENRRAFGRGQRGGAMRRIALALFLAALGCAPAAKANALSAGERAYARHDYVRAAPLLLFEAERGSPVAQTHLGYMYQNGLGVPRNYPVAASWLHRAAEQGAPTAQFLLGLLFDKGYGVPQDGVQALQSEHVRHRSPQLQSAVSCASHNSLARLAARSLRDRPAIGVETKPIM